MTVSIVKTEKAADVRRAVELLGGIERFVSSGERVVVKPNICAGHPSSSGAVTDPEMVVEVCKMVAECGGKPIVAESPVYPFKSKRVFEQSGYSDFESRYGFPFVDIDTAKSRMVRIPGGKVIDNLLLSEVVLTCDKLINMPVAKTHLQTVVTLGLKNLKGVVPGKQKHNIHLSGLEQGIVDLNSVIKSDLVIMDGIVGMEGIGGPIIGRSVKIGVIVAGDNVVEADSVGVRIMGGDPSKVKHLKLASEQGLGSLDGFETRGESIEAVSKQLDLPKTSGFNNRIMSGLMLRAMNLVRDPIMRITGGERLLRKLQIGDLIIDVELCNGCRLCLEACPVKALSYDEVILCDREMCISCFCCAEVCPKGALSKRQ